MTQTTAPVSETMKVGSRLVELCREGKYLDAITELYADDAVSIEPFDCGPQGRETRGKQVILKESEGFITNNEIHSATIDGPYPFEDRFICFMRMDMTPKEGPMAGQRIDAKEACHYTVRNGKIVRAEFYYGM